MGGVTLGVEACRLFAAGGLTRTLPLVCTSGGKALVVKGVPLHSVDGARMQADLLPVPARIDVPDPHGPLARRRSDPIAVETPGHAINGARLSG